MAAETREPEDVVRHKLHASMRAFTDQMESILELLVGAQPAVRELDKPTFFTEELPGVLEQVPTEHLHRISAIFGAAIDNQEVEEEQLPEDEDPVPESESAAHRRERLGLAGAVQTLLDEFGGHSWSGDLVHLWDRLLRRPARIQMFHASILTMAFSIYETLMERIVRVHYEHVPHAMADVEAKDTFTIKEILAAGSVDTIRLGAIDRRVRGITNAGFDGWTEWYAGTFGYEPKTHALDWNALREGVAHRHLIVHRSNKASIEYCREFSPDGSVQPGQSLPISVEYLEDFIDGLVVLGLRQLFLAWPKLAPDDSDLCLSWLSATTYDLLLLRRFAVVRALCQSALDWDKADRRTLVARVNLWLSEKRLNGLDSIRESVEQWDVRSLGSRFRLARAALLDDFDACATYLPLSVTADGLTTQELYQWPLLEEFRSDGRFAEAIAQLPPSPAQAVAANKAVAKKAAAKKAAAKKAAAKKAAAKKAAAKKAVAKKAVAKKALAKKALAKKAVAKKAVAKKAVAKKAVAKKALANNGNHDLGR